MGIIADQDRAIQGAQNPIKFYAQVAEKKSSLRFPHRATENYCVPSVSAKQTCRQDYLDPYFEK